MSIDIQPGNVNKFGEVVHFGAWVQIAVDDNAMVGHNDRTVSWTSWRRMKWDNGSICRRQHFQLGLHRRLQPTTNLVCNYLVSYFILTGYSYSNGHPLLIYGVSGLTFALIGESWSRLHQQLLQKSVTTKKAAHVASHLQQGFAVASPKDPISTMSATYFHANQINWHELQPRNLITSNYPGS